MELSVRLPDEFIAGYASITPRWGFADVAGNSIGELAFVRSYSRSKEDGGKERWHEVCRRVIEGMYHEQKQWALNHQILWDDAQGVESAMEAYEHMFHRRWAPPGRGLTVMGTPLVHVLRDSTPLQNCAFISTADHHADNPGEVYAWMMEASMLGVGVGFDTLMADEGIVVQEPGDDYFTYQIPDTREGWAESVRLLVNSYLRPLRGKQIRFDYSLVRPAGAPILTFGGKASGPGPLREAHEIMRELLDYNVGETVNSRLVTDLMNVVGKAVVSGNVRRSAQIAIGHDNDKDFIGLKDWRRDENRSRTSKEGWSWASNNTVYAKVGMDYEALLDQIRFNGEPGLAWMDVTRNYGRLGDEPDFADHRAKGYNPCGEQPLESREMCTLVNVYPTNCDSFAQYLRVLKFAYLYAKTVTLIPTRWAKTNSIMQRNRRIGASFNGAWQFVEQYGYPALDQWMGAGYEEILQWDELYSEWLCVRESIRHTTVKPDGTGSLLAGVTPGAHPSPGGEYYLRRIRYGKDDPIVPLLVEAGYKVESAFGNEDTTVVCAFPIAGPTGVRSQAEASVYEKAHLAVRMQRWWSDNSVSLTLTYHPDTEGKELGHVLRMFEGQLKSISFLKIDTDTYPQMPYEDITREQYEEYASHLKRIDLEALYGQQADAEGEKFCSNDACEIPHA